MIRDLMVAYRSSKHHSGECRSYEVWTQEPSILWEPIDKQTIFTSVLGEVYGNHDKTGDIKSIPFVIIQG